MQLCLPLSQPPGVPVCVAPLTQLFFFSDYNSSATLTFYSLAAEGWSLEGGYTPAEHFHLGKLVRLITSPRRVCEWGASGQTFTHQVE